MRLLFTTSMVFAVFNSAGFVNAADLGYPSGYGQNGTGVHGAVNAGYGNGGLGGSGHMGIRGTKSGDCYQSSNGGGSFGAYKNNQRSRFSLNCQNYNGTSRYAGQGAYGHPGNGAHAVGGRAGYGAAGSGSYGVDVSGGNSSGTYGDDYESGSYSSGWYLRGDLGYTNLDLSNVEKQVSYVDSVSGDIVYSGDNFFSAELDSSWSISGGLGYQVSNYFRVDAILKHIAQIDFTGDSSTSGSGYLCDLIDGQADDDGDTCTSVDTAKFSATLGMANAYLDLGSFAGFTPYVGGGIGGAYAHWSDMKNDTRCDNTGSNCTSTAGLSYETEFDGVHGNKSGWRFAYAAHAGASYQFASNMKFDAGYSFTNISGGDMFGFTSGGGVQGRHSDIKIHEVKAGIRYSFH